jgi:hypothetical protein
MQRCGHSYDLTRIRLVWQETQMMLLQVKGRFSSSDPDGPGYRLCHRRRADVCSSEAVTLGTLDGSARSAGGRLRATQRSQLSRIPRSTGVQAVALRARAGANSEVNAAAIVARCQTPSWILLETACVMSKESVRRPE